MDQSPRKTSLRVADGYLAADQPPFIVPAQVLGYLGNQWLRGCPESPDLHKLLLGGRVTANTCIPTEQMGKEALGRVPTVHHRPHRRAVEPPGTVGPQGQARWPA